MRYVHSSTSSKFSCKEHEMEMYSCKNSLSKWWLVGCMWRIYITKQNTVVRINIKVCDAFF